MVTGAGGLVMLLLAAALAQAGPPLPAVADPTPTYEHRSVAVMTSRDGTVAPPTPVPPTPTPTRVPNWPDSLLTVPVYSGPRDLPYVYLTFDDGWGYPHQVLEILVGRNVKATACLDGVDMSHYPDFPAAWVAAGMTLCNHTYSHSVLTQADFEDLPDQLVPPGVDYAAVESAATGPELEANEALLARLAPGAKMTPFFRPPYGSHNAAVRAAAAARGYRTILWSVDPEDWRPGATAASVRDHILANTRAGDIVLMHFGSTATLNALPAIIDGLRARGFILAGLESLPADR